MKDLRDLNEEEFKEVYEYLREKTNNFNEFTSELIIENNQFLLIIRSCLGLSQREFAERLGATKDWCRHTESGKNKIKHLSIANRYSQKIQNLLSKTEINLEKALEYYWRFIFYSKEQELKEPEIKFEKFSKINEEKLVEYFNIIKKETENFTVFNSELLVRIPQSLIIFRIILGTSLRKFQALTGFTASHMKYYEHLEMKMKKRTAYRIICKIKELFLNINKKEITIEKVLENFRILSGFYGTWSLERGLYEGVRRFAKVNHNPFEDEIAELLSKNNVQYEKYKVLNGDKREFNIDFLINSNKKIALEVFSYNNKKKIKDVKVKVCLVDHRFQALKEKHPGLITIMCIKINGRPILFDHVKRYLSIELLNTDHILINHEINNLIDLIKKF